MFKAIIIAAAVIAVIAIALYFLYEYIMAWLRWIIGIMKVVLPVLLGIGSFILKEILKPILTRLAKSAGKFIKAQLKIGVKSGGKV